MATTSAWSPNTCAEYPRDELWDALREVEDPEMAISIVDMGLIVTAEREGETARIQLTYTAMGCPATHMIEEDLQTRLLHVPGISDVEVETVWEPVWTKARLTSEGRDALQMLGGSMSYLSEYEALDDPKKRPEALDGKPKPHARFLPDTVWLVLARRAYDQPLQQIGTVEADDRDLAIVYARSIYDEFAWVEMALVCRDALVTVIES